MTYYKGVLYGLGDGIYSINTSTGKATFLFEVTGISMIEAKDGVMYGAGNDGLFSIDIKTEQQHLIASEWYSSNWSMTSDSPIVPDVSGCIDLSGSPLVNRKVILKQPGEEKKIARTDNGGCYGFFDLVLGKTVTVQINGPVLRVPVPVIYGCAELQGSGSAMADRKVILRQIGEDDKSTKTGADGCYSFTDTLLPVPDKNFKVIIKGPVMP